MVIYSHSRLNTFEQCPLKFKYQYIDKIPPEVEKTIEAHLGSIVHETLEWLYHQVKRGINPSIDETIKYYAENWERNYQEEIAIVKKWLTAKDYFNRGVEFLLNYYIKHQPFKDNTLEIEKRVVFNLDEEGKYKIQGYIDRFVHNPEKNRYEIHDYKTANNLPTQDKIDNDRQLALYAIAVKELFGEDKDVALIWHYLAHNTKIESNRTNQQLEQLKQETLELIKRIESTTEFPANKSILCSWCGYKNRCPIFKRE